MVRFKFICFSLLLIAACSNGGSVFSKEATILPANQAANVLKQCSRKTIKDADSFWTPTTEEIASLEHLLPNFLANSGVDKPSAALSSYCRQYVGVTTHGRRLIYGNFFKKSFVEGHGYDWHNNPVNVCDGGDNFWGIVFDPKAKKFDPPQYNGEA